MKSDSCDRDRQVNESVSFTCPPSLKQHLEKKAHSLEWSSEELSRSSVARLLSELFNLLPVGDIKNEKECRKVLYESSEKVFKTLRLNTELLLAFEKGEIDVKGLVEFHDHLRVKNKRIFEEIVAHHESLVTEGYEVALRQEGNLKKYKNAASDMGKVWFDFGVIALIYSQVMLHHVS